PMEVKMAQLWGELLDVERVGIHDDFFELGGHSLQATKLVLRMREAFEIPIAISALFHHPTIAGLAETLQREGVPQSELPLVRRARAGRPEGDAHAGCCVLPASQGQQRLWFLEELNPASGAAYHVCGGLDLHGPVDETRMGEALDRVVSRHEGLR